MTSRATRAALFANAALLATAVLLATAALSIVGCASLSKIGKPTPQERAQQLEPMLSAAGFAMLPADTPARMDQLSTLPPLTVSYYVGRTGKLHYWMADPKFCKCLYLGNEQAYQRYEQMRMQEKFEQKENESAEDNLAAAQEEEMDMQMEMFNPYGGLGYVGPGFYAF